MSFQYILYSDYFLCLTLQASNGIMHHTPQTTQGMAVSFLEVSLTLGAQGHTVWWLHGALACMQASSYSGRCMVLAKPCVQGSHWSVMTLWVSVSRSFCCIWCMQSRGLHQWQLVFTWLDPQHEVAASGILCPRIFLVFACLLTRHNLTLWVSLLKGGGLWHLHNVYHSLTSVISHTSHCYSVMACCPPPAS